MQPGIGFCLVMLDIGPRGNMAFISNVEREGMLKALRELLDKIT